MKTSIIIACLSFLFSSASGQQSGDNFGTEFYLAFAPNNKDRVDYLALYLASRDTAQATISISNLGYSKKVTVIPGAVTSVFLPYLDPFTAEIRQAETVLADRAVTVSSDKEIVVYGQSHRLASTDAFLGLPVDVLGKEYSILAYRSLVDTFTSSLFGKQLVKRPGQFIIVGTKDSSIVTIMPSCTTITGKPKGIPFQIMLGKGSVYLVQSDTSSSGEDLSGTKVTSDKPIAVLSGHNNTSIPDTAKNMNGGHGTTDILVEQIPPVSSWGNSAVVVPFTTTQAPDLIRILSGEDANIITVNGAMTATLNKGEFYEIPSVSAPLVIRSTNPMLVGQYMHSTILTDSIAYGDPAFTLVFPSEQYDTAYTVMCVQDKAYTASFINLSLPFSAIGKIVLDGNLIPLSEFKTIGASGFAYAQMKVSQGVHNLQSPIAFGCTVYGLGAYDSYAYVGGTLIKPLVPAEALITGFDTVLACGSYTRELRLRNPNSVDARLTSITIDEQEPSGFSIDATLPLVITPGGERIVNVRFSPPDTGYFIGTVVLVFGSPRRDTIRIPLSAYARKLAFVYRSPEEIHILAKESVLLPIYCETPLAPFNIQNYDLRLRYDPSIIEDVDYVLGNTHSTYGYIDVRGDAGDRTLHFTSIPGYFLSGGKINDSTPLIKIKFASKEDLYFDKIFRAQVNADLIVTQAAIEDNCLEKTYKGGMIVIDSVCSSPHLAKGILPEDVYLRAPFPNPASDFIEIQFDAPSTSENNPIFIELFDEFGRSVLTIEQQATAPGRYKRTLDVSCLSNGCYMLRMKCGQKTRTRSLFILK